MFRSQISGGALKSGVPWPDKYGTLKSGVPQPDKWRGFKIKILQKGEVFTSLLFWKEKIWNLDYVP